MLFIVAVVSLFADDEYMAGKMQMLSEANTDIADSICLPCSIDKATHRLLS